MKKLLLYIVLINISLINQCLSWTINKLTEYPNAKCLDGSSPAYYFKKATSQNNEKKFLIKFYSFGFCGSEALNQEFIANCYQRIYSDRGSSNYLNKNPYDAVGMFSSVPEINPQYHDWNMIIFHSCDGSIFQGHSDEPIMFKNAKLWFRGYDNGKASIEDVIKKFNLNQAEQVVINGCSAGGLAAAYWLNYFRDQVSSQVKMYAVLDAAFLMDTINIQTKTYLFRDYLIKMMSLINSDQDPVNSDCVDDNPEEKWKCMILQYLQPYIKVPIFITQSLTDIWQFIFLLGQFCDNVKNQNNECVTSCSNKPIDSIEHFKQEYIAQMNAALEQDLENRYVWTTNCMAHCVVIDEKLFNNPKYAQNNKNQETIAQALENWSKKIVEN